MILFLAVIALLLALVYFLSQEWRSNDVWQRFRQRYRERRRHYPPEQPIDPTFQFDRHSEAGERQGVDDPHRQEATGDAQ